MFYLGMLVYRSCRCCRRVWSKLLHMMFHLLAIPCIVIGFMAAWDYHALQEKPIPHFYSIHSWLGLATMAMFLLQFVSGIFSFLLLMCCSSSTASFRSSMVPVHSTLGTTTFLMAVATCIAGITETALFKLRSEEYFDNLHRNQIEISHILRDRPQIIYKFYGHLLMIGRKIKPYCVMISTFIIPV